VRRLATPSSHLRPDGSRISYMWKNSRILDYKMYSCATEFSFPLVWICFSPKTNHFRPWDGRSPIGRDRLWFGAAFYSCSLKSRAFNSSAKKSSPIFGTTVHSAPSPDLETARRLVNGDNFHYVASCVFQLFTLTGHHFWTVWARKLRLGSFFAFFQDLTRMNQRR
jgi:hypothetical protein